MNKKTAYHSPDGLAQSFANAFRGIWKVTKQEHNMQIHILVAFIALILGIFLHLSRPEWIMIIFCIGLVLTMEIINTTIENLVDLLSPEKNELAGKVKDAAAGAVLISAITAGIVGLMVFIPHIAK